MQVKFSIRTLIGIMHPNMHHLSFSRSHGVDPENIGHIQIPKHKWYCVSPDATFLQV